MAEEHVEMELVDGSSIDMYNNDVGKRFMKYKGTLTSATLYFTS
jgi:hypothetical protein